MIHLAPMRRLAFLLTFALVPPAQAEIYKFVDDNGMVTYTNMPRPGSKPQVVIPDTGAPVKLSPKAGKSKSGNRVGTPSYFPKVDVGTQRKRDDMRRVLLEEEMRSEEKNLAAARADLDSGRRQPGADMGKLLDAVRMHEKNIEMLNKELSHIR